MPDFAFRSSEQWQAVKALDSSRSIGGWTDDKEREAFQLVMATVLYLANGLPHFCSLHKPWRDGASVNVGVSFSDDDSPASLFAGSSEAVGQMHLASAAFRLPVALQKTIETHAGAATVFGNLWGPNPSNKKRPPDWRRENMSDSFSKVKTLSDCATGALSGTDDQRLQYAITIITVVRDDFGHGEEGNVGPASNYMRDREGVLDTLYACRIVEAAQLLVGWAIGKLNQAKGP